MAKIDEIKMLRLGQRDENLARSLTFDCSDWLEQYPAASIHILFRRPGESAIVPMPTTLEGTTLTWLIHDFEVGKTGVGNAEFRAVDTAGLRRKSRIIPCSIEETLLGDDETVLYTQDQVDETLAHISEAAQAAQAAKASEEAAALSAQEAGESAASAGTAADVAVSARDAAQAAQTAAETAQHQAEAAQSGVHVDAEAAEQAKVAAQAAQASAQGAASQASADRTAAESARADAEAAATHAEAVVDGIDQAGADQVAAVNAAGQAQVSAVNQAGTTQVGNVNAAGTTQVNAVQAKGTQVINSIPADYSALTDEVTGLKSAITQQTTNENTDYNNIIDWNNIKNEKLMWDAGIYRDNAGYWSTDYIPIQAGKEYIKYNPVTGSYPGVQRIHAFDSAKQSIGLVSWVDNKATMPSNAAYIVISKRYVHGGSVGEYNPTPDWDDDIGKMVINVADNGAFHAPYPYYLSDDIEVRHEISSRAKVHSIDNAIKDNTSVIKINRSQFTANEEIQIKICGINIFDGVTQDGYWNGASVVTNSTHKASVNPIYVNGGSYIITSAGCRVTEFKSDGTYNTSAIAISRTPYLISANTDYFHISSEIANMENMCVYIGTKAPDINQAYKETIVTHTIRNWGTTIYDVSIPLYDGYNTVCVKRNNAPSLTLQYNANIKTLNSEFVNVQKSVDSICDFSGIKMAGSNKYAAHRGSTLQAPENTTYAIVQAFKNGFKNVELDVRMTSDGVPVLLHDSTIDRTSNGTGAVSSMTLATLQTYDFGSWFSSKFANTKIPTLDQACRLCRALNIKPHLDIAGSNVSESMANAICDILKKYELLDGAVFYVNGSSSGAPYFRAYYANTGAKYYMYYQVAGFGDNSILTLMNNINQTFRNYDMIYDIGISANITDMSSAVKEAAIGYERRIPIAVYFVDSYTDYQSVQDYPYALYCTNRGDIPNFAAQYFAPRSIWT